MPDLEFRSSWGDPRYVAAIVSVLATGALYFYSGLTQSGLTVEEITLVIFAILLPTSITYEITRRL